jgi:hypothetical protein
MKQQMLAEQIRANCGTAWRLRPRLWRNSLPTTANRLGIPLLLFCLAVHLPSKAEEAGCPGVQAARQQTNVHAMLQRIKAALESGAVLRRAFYSTAGLNCTFGTYKWTLSADSSAELRFLFSDQGIESLADVAYTGLSGGQLVLKDGDGPNAQFSFAGGVRATDDRYRVEELNRVMGPPTRIEAGASYTAPMHGHAASTTPATHRLGNSRLTYEIPSSTYTIRLSALTNEAGIVTEFQIYEREKQ